MKRLTCKVACINDCMDPSKANCEWYVHPDFPQILLVISTKRIACNEQLFISYGPDYWCQDRFSVHILLAAVIGYAIDIDASSEWRKLKAYKELRTAHRSHITNHTHQTSPDVSSPALSDSSMSQVRCPPFSQHDGDDFKHIDIDTSPLEYNNGCTKTTRTRDE